MVKAVRVYDWWIILEGVCSIIVRGMVPSTTLYICPKQREVMDIAYFLMNNTSLQVEWQRQAHNVLEALEKDTEAKQGRWKKVSQRR